MIVLVGFMGAGKTTVGRLLAERLGIPFVDVDRLIEIRECCSISQIFAERGEETFRRIEHETVTETLNGPDAVVALGGGAVEHPGTLLVLNSAFVVYLEVEFDEAVLRIGHDNDRPMMSNPFLSEIYRRRLSSYSRVSNLTIQTGGRGPEQIVGDIISKITTAT
ncbi:MAG: shikimate kinase [Acidimicrobiaceae bacterium]|nr:shikimate kinase [Acidimicrobiaceae bacterium]